MKLIDDFEAALGGDDPGAFVSVCAPDVHYEDPLLREPLEGPAAIGAHAQRLRAGFPDVRVEKTGEHLSDGRFVAAPAKILGTHRNDLEGIPPTGRFLVVHVVFYAELDPPRERLWRVRAFFDVYDAAQQLGVLPRHGGVGERALLMLRGFGLNRQR
ncbi:MAG: ester cyclase [Solirubrobacteraceae bacterium]